MDLKYHIISRIAAALLIIAGGIVICVQSPKFQTFIAGKVLESINKELSATGADICVGQVSIQPDGSVVIKDAALLDRKPYCDTSNSYGFQPQDTIMHFNTICATFSLKNLFRDNALYLKRAVVDGATINIVCEPCDYQKQLPNINRALGIKPPENKRDNDADIFEISKVELNDVHVSLRSYVREKPVKEDKCIDWNDFECIAWAEAENMSFRKGVMKGHLVDVHATVKGGYELIHIDGDAKVGNGRTLVENAKIIDKWSDINLSHLELTYSNAAAFRDYNDKVHMDILPERSLISSKTIQYFTHLNPDSNVFLDWRSGRFIGYVNDAVVKKLEIIERLSGFPLQIDGSLTGLGHPGNFAIDITAKAPSFTTASLGRFIKGFSPKSKEAINRFAKDKQLSFNLNAKGRLSNLNIDTRLSGEIGTLEAIFNLANINDEEDITIKGDFNLEAIDLGSFFGKEALGQTDATATLSTAFTEEGPSVFLDSLIINRLSLKGYDYQGISAEGKMTDEYFDGKIVCSDPNADLDFTGVINYGFTGDKFHSVYQASIRNFDLSKTHLFEQWETARIKAKLSADYFATSRTDATGKCSIDSLVLDNGIDRSEFSRIGLKTYEENRMYHLVMNSDIASITVSSDITIPEAIKGLCNATILREIPDILPKLKNPESEPGNMMLDIKVADISEVLSFFYPKLNISKGTSLQLSTDRDGSVNAFFSSQGITFKNNDFKGIDLSLDNLYGSLNAILSAEEVKLGNLQLTKNTFSAYIDDNKLNVGLDFSGRNPAEVYGELYLKGSAEKAEDGSNYFIINPLPSFIVMRESKWQTEESAIEIGKNGIDISKLQISNGDQSIEADGGISRTKADTLTLILHDLDLASADEFTGKKLGIKGIASGKASIYSSENNGKILIGRVFCNGLDIRDCDFGDISISSIWNESTQRLDIGMMNKNTGRNSIAANGSYTPKNKTFTSNVSLGNLSMELLSAIVPKSISKSGGSVSGNLSISGKAGKFDVLSNGITLNDILICPTATNVPYTINGIVRMRSGIIEMPEISIKDQAIGTGTISGNISHKSFRNLNFKLDANLKNLILIDKPENPDNFYGKIVANAKADLNGPLKALNVWADATTSSPGEIHIPLANTITQKQSDLLTFKKADEDPQLNTQETVADGTSTSEKSDISIRCRINATENLKAFIEIDKENENIIEASGEGIINAEIRPAKNIVNLSGDYNITDGQYHFTALGSLIRKDFTINQGSSIKFGGNIKETKLDVNTTYSLKASLSSLISDSTSVATRRTVNCGINIGNDIKSPSLSFSINIPDLDPTTKSKVEGALNTEDKVQRQFVSLLLTNSFYPAEQSGVSYNDSNILYSNISNIMSGQVNSILKKLDIPIDLGLSYLKNEVGTNIFDVAVSTQLFNNRVQINGSVGNRQRSTSTGKDVVGNIDIGIKLDKEGKLQMKLFSHSSDDYTKFLDNGQKNGLGISYQKEFKNRKTDSDSTKVIVIE